MFKRLNLLLLGILLLGVFFRFYQLGQIPAGLTNDEADIGYDAFSILKTGKDQWGSFLPINSFRGFGDNRPVFYTYLVTPFISIFDLNSLSVRLPSAIAGSLSIVAIYFLARRFIDEKTAHFAAFLFAISPWSIGLSRLGVESNVAIFFVLIALIFLTGFKEKTENLYLGLFFLAITPYTYSAYFLFSFLILFAFILFYKSQLIKVKKKLLIALIFFVVLISPLLVNTLTARTRLAQVGLTTNVNSIGIVQVLNDTRGHCQSTYPAVICKVLNNKPAAFSSQLVKNYMSHFSPDLLYLSGTNSQFSILPARGLGYIFESILLMIGVFAILKTKKRESLFLLIMLILSPIPDALTGSGNYSRASIMLPFLILVEGAGMAIIFKWLWSLKNKSIRLGSIGLAVLVVFIAVISFFVSYTSYFKKYYSRHSQYGYQQLSSELQSQSSKYDKIYISRNLNDAKQYVYYLFYTKYDPASFQAKKNVDLNIEEGGWVNVSRIGNIHFIPNMSSVKLTQNSLDKKMLFFAHPSEFPDKISKVKDINDLVGTTLFREVDSNSLKPFISNDQ